MMTAMIIVGGLSSVSTLLLLGGLVAAKRAARPSFDSDEIAFSQELTVTSTSDHSNVLAPAFSH